MRCTRCGTPQDMSGQCECAPCAACPNYDAADLMIVNPDGDLVCVNCFNHGRRSPEAIEADEDTAAAEAAWPTTHAATTAA